MPRNFQSTWMIRFGKPKGCWYTVFAKRPIPVNSNHLQYAITICICNMQLQYAFAICNYNIALQYAIILHCNMHALRCERQIIGLGAHCNEAHSCGLVLVAWISKKLFQCKLRNNIFRRLKPSNLFFSSWHGKSAFSIDNKLSNVSMVGCLIFIQSLLDTDLRSFHLCEATRHCTRREKIARGH